MQRKKVSTPTMHPKPITYMMQPDIQNALAALMQQEPSLNTLHKAINYCIVHHVPLVNSLRKAHADFEALEANRDFYKDAADNLIFSLRKFDKHTNLPL